MKRIFLVCFIVFWAFSAHAYTFSGSWVNINDYTLDLSVVDSSLPLYTNVDQISATSDWSLVSITDSDSSSSVSAGDSFYDVIIFNLGTLSDLYGNDTPLSNDGIEMTAEIIMEGVVTSATATNEEYTFTNLLSAEVYLDYGNGRTAANFGSLNFDNFVDGANIISGVDLVSGSPDGNDGNLSTNQNSSYQVAMSIKENYYSLFKTADGDAVSDLFVDMAFYADGDLTKLNEDNGLYSDLYSQFSSTTSLSSYLVGDTTRIYDLTETDATIDFAAVPEPSTLLLLGAGLAGLGFYSRRRNS